MKKRKKVKPGKTPTKAGKAPSFGKLAIWILAGATLVIGGVVVSQQPTKAADVVVFKSPTCGCCKKWVSHLERNGYRVDVRNESNMGPIKKSMEVPGHLQSCHTAKVDGYVVEGHVPADLIARMLKEKPKIKGLAVPGMPMGSPGMEGPRKDNYAIVAFRKGGKTDVYARR